MICTCTMNPSLDYYMEFDSNLVENVSNRSDIEYYEAGGKGINVSIVLNNLGIPTRAFGFVGGFTKDFYISLLAKYEEIRPNFTYINGHTRVNVKLRTQGNNETDLNATGPYITPEDMNNLMKKVSTLYEQDYLVLAGNMAEYLVDSTEQMLIRSMEEGVHVVLDTEAKVMKDMLPYHPFLYKTTDAEIRQLVENFESVEDAAKQLHKLGAKNVLVLKEDHTSILVCDKGVYSSEILSQGQAVNTVGTGDSLTAGFLMNYIRSKDAVDSFRFGASCGSATAYSKGLATREKIDKMYDQTVVTCIEEF